jgi:hypothetical protein
MVLITKTKGEGLFKKTVCKRGSETISGKKRKRDSQKECEKNKTERSEIGKKGGGTRA